MKNVEIEVKGIIIGLEFGYGVLRRLGEKWGINSITGIFDRFGAHLNKDGIDDNDDFGDIGIDKMNLFGDLISAAASTAGYDINSDDAVNALMSDPTKMRDIMLAFMESFPKPTEEQKKTIAQMRVKG
ncbi:MAG: hypothetical protein LBE34_13910 [Flavobacteriaceae bacterium]|jgi:hypothetical protein|nr:hypothetical protein [Flavobacteriaceae bacterium]